MLASGSLSVPKVSDESLAAIARIGRTRSPQEACGLLLIDLDATNQRVIELANQSERPQTSYEFRAENVATTLAGDPLAGVEVVIWHTHPGGSVGPSTEDVQNKLEGVPYLVVALFNNGTMIPQWF